MWCNRQLAGLTRGCFGPRSIADRRGDGSTAASVPERRSSGNLFNSFDCSCPFFFYASTPSSPDAPLLYRSSQPPIDHLTFCKNGRFHRRRPRRLCQLLVRVAPCGPAPLGLASLVHHLHGREEQGAGRLEQREPARICGAAQRKGRVGQEAERHREHDPARPVGAAERLRVVGCVGSRRGEYPPFCF